MLFLYWNCCGGVKGKMPTIEHILATYKPEIFFIAEAEYESTHTFVKFRGYDVFCSRTIEYGKSRLVTVIKKGSMFKSRVILVNDLEVLCFESNSTLIIGVYRPFTHINGNNGSLYLQKLHSVLESLCSTTKNIFVVGDFNINYNLQSKEKDDMEIFALNYGLDQKITENTWERIITKNGTKSLKTSRIDLCFSNNSALVAVEDRFNSDHCLISIDLFHEQTKIIRKKHYRRDWRKYTSDTFSSELQEIVSLTSDDEKAENLEAKMTENMIATLDQLCPIRVIRTNRLDDVIDQELEKLKKKRKRLKKDYNISKNTHLLDVIETLNYKIKKRIQNSKKKQIDVRPVTLV